MNQLIDEAEQALELFRRIDRELRNGRRRVHRDTWASIITQCVFLGITIDAAKKIEEARNG
jgi:hypothetical protein